MKNKMKLALRNLILTGAVMTAFQVRAPAAQAVSNPLIRVCTVNGGTFEVWPRGTTDDIALCRWNQAVVDSQSILSNLEGVTTRAANLVLTDTSAASCQDVSAVEFKIPSGEILCSFNDDSKLSLEAVRAGLSNSDRLLLKQALLAR